jgi:D-alanyl-D-alanine carboxypeptidase
MLRLKHRPHSAALAVENDVVMRPAGSAINIAPGQPACIGKPDCTATLSGDLPVGFVPPLTNHYPLIRVFRIADPSSYARTVLIEKLSAAGVKVDAPTVEPNPIHLLPAKNCYEPDTRVAELHGMPYAEDAKLIAKVSYNIGADTSLLLYGVTQGADDMPSALAAERKTCKPTTASLLANTFSSTAAAMREATVHWLPNGSITVAIRSP